MDDIVIKTTKEYAAEYIAAGFALCAIQPKHKGPYQKNWGDLTLDIERLKPGEGLGLIHARSGTCVVDIDDMAKAEPYFLACGIDIEAVLAAPDAVRINSSRPNRAKLLYKVPAGLTTLPTHKRLPNGFEFRCAPRNGNGMQDVLPPSIHPDTNVPYMWDGAGSFFNIPELPKEILSLWLSFGSVNDIGPSSTSIKSDLDILDPMTPERWLDITSALEVIPSDDHDIWISVGMALKPYGDGLELWDAWSSKSPVYDANNIDHTWHSLNPRDITYKSIFELATKTYNWVNPAKGVSKQDQDAKKSEFEFTQLLADPLGPQSVGQVVDFDDMDTPDPELVFYVGKWIPQGQVTLMAGHGGGGKSFAAMSLAVHVALGLNFGGLPVQQAVTYFFSAEDNALQVRKRIKAICIGMTYPDGAPVHPAHLTGKLIVSDVTGILPVLYRHGVQPTLALVTNHVKAVRAELVVIDNASDAFDGDEIKRNEVKGFIQALRMYLAGSGGTEEDVAARGADSYPGAVLLLTHINKGAANGTSTEDYSGSTAWHNSVRSRLSLVPKEDKTGFEIHHMKSNYSQLADPITMLWVNGAFRPHSADKAVMATLERKEATLTECKPLILKAFQLAEIKGIRVASKPNTPTPPLVTLSELVVFPRNLAKKEFVEMLEALVKSGDLKHDEVVGSNRSKVAVYVLAKGTIFDNSDLL